MQRSQTRWTPPPCRTKATAEKCVVSFSQSWSPVFTGFHGDDRRDRDEIAHPWIRCQPRSLKGRVSPRKSLQSSFNLGQPGSRGRSSVPSALLCYFVPLNKSAGCELDCQPLLFTFIRHLLLSSGVYRVACEFEQLVSTTSSQIILQFDRCAHD